MTLREYTLTISTEVTGPARTGFTVEGDFILVTSAPGPFLMYIDGGVAMPMRAGRSLQLETRCKHVEVGFDEAGWSGVMVIKIVVATDAIARDSRVGFFANAQFKEMGAAEIFSSNYTHAIDDEVISLGARPGQFRVMIRNTGSDTFRFASGGGGLANDAQVALQTGSPGAGIIVEPGEIAEFSIGVNYETGQETLLLARAPVGATCTVTWFCHPTS